MCSTPSSMSPTTKMTARTRMTTRQHTLLFHLPCLPSALFFFALGSKERNSVCVFFFLFPMKHSLLEMQALRARTNFFQNHTSCTETETSCPGAQRSGKVGT